MVQTTAPSTYYADIPVFRRFGRLMDPTLYVPLPGDWMIGVADIVDSTKAISEQRYKAVNMAGAAIIAAVTNALAGRDFPFVFGGDGASFAVAAEDAGIVIYLRQEGRSILGDSRSAWCDPFGVDRPGTRGRPGRVPQIDRTDHHAGRAQSECRAARTCRRSGAALAACRLRL